MAGELKQQVDAGEMTKDRRMATLRKLGNAMTYDNGSGYLFATGYDGITQMSPDPKQVGTNRMDVVTNGRKLSQEMMDGVRANGEILLRYEYVKPSQETPIRKIGYAVAIPGFDMYLGTGAYLDDLDAKLKPIAGCSALATIGIGVICGRHRLADRPRHQPSAQYARRPHAGDRQRRAGSDIPGAGRGDEVGKMAKTVQIFKDNALRMREMEKVGSRDPRARARRNAVRRWKASPATSSAASTASSIRSPRPRRACKPPRSR